MILERWMHDGWLSNTYLVADRQGGEAVIVDTGAEPEPVIERARNLNLRVRWILNTHHHHDHSAANEQLRRALDAPVAAHAAEAQWLPGLDGMLEEGEELEFGALTIRVLHIPGHTAGQIALWIESEGAAGPSEVEPGHVFTGDTLFRRSIGGNVAPGHTTFDDLRRSIMDRLMSLPKDTVVHPGHTVPTTIGEEWESNPFIRVMRGVDPEGNDRCRASGRPARLVVHARDYDDGMKAWVRFDDGIDAVVPGSVVMVDENLPDLRR